MMMVMKLMPTPESSTFPRFCATMNISKTLDGQAYLLPLPPLSSSVHLTRLEPCLDMQPTPASERRTRRSPRFLRDYSLPMKQEEGVGAGALRHSDKVTIAYLISGKNTEVMQLPLALPVRLVKGVVASTRDSMIDGAASSHISS